MKPHHFFAFSSATSWSALTVNQWFLEWNPTLQGLVFILAIITSLFAIAGYLKHKK